MPNAYTRRWFATFLGRIDPTIVEREVAFLRRQLVPGAHVLDLCCGPGRHAAPLSDAGYRVTGLDRDAAALSDATRSAPRASFVRADMRRPPLAAAGVDAVICMWQSFGHFDAATNMAVLTELHRVTTPNGTIILDLYNRDYHAAHIGERVIDRDGERIHESRTMDGDRLRAALRYDSAAIAEEFEWQLYTPADIVSVARSAGFRLRTACADFDERLAPTAERARMQIVFDRA